MLLCTESLKDELRAEHKVNKPRLFRVLPLHHMFLVKKYLGQMMKFNKENMWKTGVMIGFNPYIDFDRLYKELLVEYLHFDGDFGDYDGSAASQLQDIIAEEVYNIFDGSEEEKVELKILLNSMIRSYVLTREALTLTTHSMPSGCWVTALLNSLYNRLLTAIVLKRNRSNASVMDFLSIKDFVMGDDKIVGVPRYLSDSVNALTMKELAESLGMTFTDSKKGEILNDRVKLDDCTFLKREII